MRDQVLESVLVCNGLLSVTCTQGRQLKSEGTWVNYHSISSFSVFRDMPPQARVMGMVGFQRVPPKYKCGSPKTLGKSPFEGR